MYLKYTHKSLLFYVYFVLIAPLCLSIYHIYLSLPAFSLLPLYMDVHTYIFNHAYIHMTQNKAIC